MTAVDALLHLHFEPGHSGHCSTPPGHVLHLIYEGEYELSINRHHFHAAAGDFIIYHDIEAVEWISNAVPVSFYSIVFHADHLQLKPYTQRLIRGKKRFQKLMADTYTHYHSLHPDPLLVHSALLQMLSDVYRDCDPADSKDADNPWPGLEQQLRQQELFRPSLNQCCMLSGYSSASLSRYCHELYQQSPMQRLRFIRLQHARSLLTLSSMSISQIADHLSYPRIHEFSREFKLYSGKTPTEFRNAPD